MVIPGSHKGPVIDHNSQGFFCGAIDPIKSPLNYDNAVPLIGSAGTMTIHHVRAIHGSALNMQRGSLITAACMMYTALWLAMHMRYIVGRCKRNACAGFCL